MGLFHFGGQYGNPFVSPAYFAASFVACLGVFQVIAAVSGYVGLSWLPMAWQPWAGVPVGMLLIAGSTAWFFSAFSDAIFRPGPAGLELFVIVAGAAALALAVTLTGATVVQAGRARARHSFDQDDAAAGLSLLRSMTYLEAMRRRPIPQHHPGRADLDTQPLPAVTDGSLETE